MQPDSGLLESGMPNLQILPSILGADVGNLRAACERAEASGADGIHIDLMDGHFVPNLSFSPSVVAMVRGCTSIHRNVHLMLSRPDCYLETFVEAGAQTLSIHIESDCDAGETLKVIRDLDCRSGLVLNPDTRPEAVRPHLDRGLVDELLFMTVFPGFGGQSFIADVMPGLREIRDAYPTQNIAVDGGLNRETCQIAREHGANTFHIGSGLFRPPDMRIEIQILRKLLT